MGKVPLSPDSRIYVDEFDFSGVLNSMGFDISQETPVVTCISDAGPRRVVGNYDAKQSHLGFFEGTEDGFDQQIHALLADGNDHYITHCFGASAEASVAYDFVARLSALPRSASEGGAILLNFDSESSEGVVRGLVLGNKTTTGAEDLDGQNQGATTANTIYAVIFRVVTFDGTDITLHIEESSDDGGGDAYADIAGLTATFTDIGVERHTTVAATEAWKRVVIAGDFTTALILVTAGTVQGTVPPV